MLLGLEEPGPARRPQRKPLKGGGKLKGDLAQDLAGDRTPGLMAKAYGVHH